LSQVSASSRPEGAEDDHDGRRGVLRPVRLRDRLRPVSPLEAAARRAALYYNRRYDFFALSQFEDVDRCSIDWETYISGKGTLLELIKSGMELPPGSIIFEDPPTHHIHRRILARVFTPRSINDLEPKVREFCARSLDPLVEAGGFDFIADLGAQMPMRTIGVLLGIP
jgi:cytochrome P450